MQDALNVRNRRLQKYKNSIDNINKQIEEHRQRMIGDDVDNPYKTDQFHSHIHKLGLYDKLNTAQLQHAKVFPYSHLADEDLHQMKKDYAREPASTHSKEVELELFRRANQPKE